MDKKKFSIKSIGGKIRLLIPVLALLLIIPIAAGAQNQRDNADKQQVLHEVAQKWIEVGREQYNRGLYKQAEQSLRFAQDYQDCLTAAEREQLKALLEKACAAATEKERILEDIKSANKLAEQGRLTEARGHFEKIRDAAELTKEEQKLVAEGLKGVNHRLSEQKKEIDELYKQSMDFYGKGEIEKAREGFLKIDNILAGITVPSAETAEKTAASIPKSAVSIADEKGSDETTWEPVEKKEQEEQAVNESKTEDSVEAEITEEPNEFSAAGVPVPSTNESRGIEITADRKENILRGYTKAVVTDAIAKAQSYISEGSIEEAKQAIKAAEQTVNKNREHLGDELSQQYLSQLEQLTEKITEKQNKKN